MTGTFWIQFRGEYGILLIFFGEYICRAFFFETSWGVSTNPSEKNMIVNLDHLPQKRVVYIKKHVRIHHWSEKLRKPWLFQCFKIISILGIGSQQITNHECIQSYEWTQGYAASFAKNSLMAILYPNIRTNKQTKNIQGPFAQYGIPQQKPWKLLTCPFVQKICTAPTIRCFPTSPNHSQLIKKIPLHPNYQQIYPYLKNGWGWKRTSFLLGTPAYF